MRGCSAVILLFFLAAHAAGTPSNLVTDPIHEVMLTRWGPHAPPESIDLAAASVHPTTAWVAVANIDHAGLEDALYAHRAWTARSWVIVAPISYSGTSFDLIVTIAILATNAEASVFNGAAGRLVYEDDEYDFTLLTPTASLDAATDTVTWSWSATMPPVLNVQAISVINGCEVEASNGTISSITCDSPSLVHALRQPVEDRLGIRLVYGPGLWGVDVAPNHPSSLALSGPVLAWSRLLPADPGIRPIIAQAAQTYYDAINAMP